MESFPTRIPFWGADKIISNVKVVVEDIETGEQEDARLSAILEAKRGRTYTDESGRSVMDLQIRRWNARGPSELLGETIELVVKPGEDQPQSRAVANQPETDFPATLTFNVVSDMYIGDELVAEDSPGKAVCRSVETIPPLGEDVFKIEKDLEEAGKIRYGSYTVQPMACATSIATLSGWQRVLFDVGHAFGMVSDEVYDKTLFRK